MPVNHEAFHSILKELQSSNATLVAVSKLKSVQEIRELYDLGQRDFGENYVQELLEKQAHLPADIRWHFIGHLQSNKVKYIAPFVYLIQGVDSLKLLKEINKQGKKLNRKIRVLLQVHIAREETKFGLDEDELANILEKEAELLPFVDITGLMGMASYTEEETTIREEFNALKQIFDRYQSFGFQVLSMGMSGDYRLALSCGSTMVRIGSLLFGFRRKV